LKSGKEIESVIIDPDHVFPDSNESNNVWTAGSGKIEKDIVLDSYLGTYSSKNTPLKITFTEKNSLLTLELPNYPKFTADPVAGAVDTFESQRAGLRFVFTKTGLKMTILENSQVMEFTKE
jgi:hypothetical protein